MKYYSEKTKKLFDTEKDLVSAEKEFDKVEEENRKTLDIKRARAKEVDDAYKMYATKVKESELENKKLSAEYLKLRDAFINDYGSYHMSYTETGTIETTLSDLLAELLGVTW